MWLSYLPTPFQKKTGETTTITQNMQKHETTYEICKKEIKVRKGKLNNIHAQR